MQELNHTPQSEILVYKNPNNSIQLDVKLDRDTLWLTLQQMADLFATDRTSI